MNAAMKRKSLVRAVVVAVIASLLCAGLAASPAQAVAPTIIFDWPTRAVELIVGESFEAKGMTVRTGGNFRVRNTNLQRKRVGTNEWVTVASKPTDARGKVDYSYPVEQGVFDFRLHVASGNGGIQAISAARRVTVAKRAFIPLSTYSASPPCASG